LGDARRIERGSPTADVKDEELLRQGREALKLRRYVQASDLLSEYCERLTKQETPIAAGVLANYGLALGHTRRLKEGLDICLKALSYEPRNPHVYLNLAQLYILANSKKKAVEAIERGLRVSPDHRWLLQLREEMGIRKPPPIPFLSRNSAVNATLGKAIRKPKPKPRRMELREKH
jgi:tetratricopeptide (TPR) repeat protein